MEALRESEGVLTEPEGVLSVLEDVHGSLKVSMEA